MRGRDAGAVDGAAGDGAGEDGSFDFPAETQTLQMVPSSITRIPIGALIEDGLQDQVDLGSAQLALPQGADESTLEQMRLGEDSHSLG